MYCTMDVNPTIKLVVLLKAKSIDLDRLGSEVHNFQ
jgi:hypothetical protein